MRLGLIARADSRGLGVQTKAFHDNMAPAKTLVVCTSEAASAQPLPIRTNWYPGAQTCPGLPSAGDLDDFLNDIDTVYTAETGYGHLLWDIAEKRNIRTVLHANFEFLNPADRPTQWLAPSLWRITEWPNHTIHLPFPVETDKFPTPHLPELPTHLLHIVGRPTQDRNTDLHRNGTIDLLAALQHVTQPCTVTIRCQHDTYVDHLIAAHSIRIPNNVNLKIMRGDLLNYWDAYQDQHAMILPRRFGGLCLPANEAVAAGIPVVMTDIDPNNTWLPKPWLVPATPAGSFRAKQIVHCHAADPAALATKISQLLTDPQWYTDAKKSATHLGRRLSWQSLKPMYEQICIG